MYRLFVPFTILSNCMQLHGCIYVQQHIYNSIQSYTDNSYTIYHVTDSATWVITACTKIHVIDDAVWKWAWLSPAVSVRNRASTPGLCCVLLVYGTVLRDVVSVFGRITEGRIHFRHKVCMVSLGEHHLWQWLTCSCVLCLVGGWEGKLRCVALTGCQTVTITYVQAYNMEVKY